VAGFDSRIAEVTFDTDASGTVQTAETDRRAPFACDFLGAEKYTRPFCRRFNLGVLIDPRAIVGLVDARGRGVHDGRIGGFERVP
jgi:hypothetical protein